MNYDEAISILAHRFSSPTVGATEEYVEALHAIIADVIDSCALATHALVFNSTGDDALGEACADDVRITANDYVANHYGIEEFGL